MTMTTHATRGRLVTIAVTSGKGGVGKTNISINLGVALARLRHRVAVLDADFGLGNVDVMLGLAPTLHLGHVLAGEKTVTEILAVGPHGVMIIPAGSGMRQLTALSPAQWACLAGAIEEIAEQFDYLIVDTGAGVSDNVLEAARLGDRVVVVTSLDPSAVVDAYAVIKLLSANDPTREIGVLVNNARDMAEAQVVFTQLDVAARRFLKRRLTDYGFIAHDPSVREAILVQRPIVDHLPQSAASRGFRILASRLTGMDGCHGAGLRLVVSAQSVARAVAPEPPRCA